MLLEFVHFAPCARVVFGIGALDRLPGEIALLGGKRVMLIAKRRPSALGDMVKAHWDMVLPHVPQSVAEGAIANAKEIEADVVVSIGGGAATGLAKAVAAATGAVVIAVPTTYAGSEATPTYGVTGVHKVTRRDPKVQPRTIIYDPALTLGLPPKVTAASGMNALAHSVNALSTLDTDPISALHAREAIHVLASALRRLAEHPHDLTARAEALFGAYLSGTALAATGPGPHHKICHVLGGDYGLNHAETHAVLLPHTAAHMHVSLDVDLAALAAEIGAPQSLAAIGMPVDAIDEAARRAAAAIPTTTIPTTTAGFAEEDIRAILHHAL